MQAKSSDLDHLNWLQALGFKSVKNLSLLDVGCGTGFVCHEAMRQGAKRAVGLDIVKPSGINEQSTWQFINGDLNSDQWIRNLDDKNFDLILAFDILEHLDSPYRFLKTLRECMKTDSKLILTTPNLTSWERYAKPESWSGVLDEQHKTLFSRYSLKFLLSKVDLQCELLKAPVRSLGGFGPLVPQIGGQIVCVAKPKI